MTAEIRIPVPARELTWDDLQPDVMVIRRGSQQPQRTVVAPVLVVQVLSPSTRTTDRTTKRALHERFGVQHYWIIDPAEPSALALELSENGSYVEVASVSGEDTFVASGPFALEFTPAALVAE